MKLTRAELVARIAEAIAHVEGFYDAGTRARRNHNPGNLRSWGNVRRVDGFASFPSDEAGWEALRSQVSRNIRRGLTLLEFFGGKAGVYPGYAPESDSNAPVSYARVVAARVGIPVDVRLDEVA